VAGRTIGHAWRRQAGIARRAAGEMALWSADPVRIKDMGEEAVESLREEGRRVSSMHLQFLQPLQGGVGAAMRRFQSVMTIEANWSDRPEDALIDDDNRRYAAVATLLRARYLVDVDCWSEVRGQPIKPGTLRRVLAAKLDAITAPVGSPT